MSIQTIADTDIKCQFRRYRYKAERDCLEVKSPTGKIVEVKLLGCKNMEAYWKFSQLMEDIDNKGEFNSNSDWNYIMLTKEQMQEFLDLSKNK